MKKINTQMMIIVAVLFSCLLLMGCPDDTKSNTVSAGKAHGKLLILQAYGNAGDGSPAGVSHSFVELYNISDTAIDLKGISLYYANGVRGKDVTEDEPWTSMALSGTIPAKGSFLILGAKHGDLKSTRFVIPDGYGDINTGNLSLNRRGFKVALIESTAHLTVANPFVTDDGKAVPGYIDMVGTANNPDSDNPDNIFGFELAPARCSASEAVRRQDLDDTDDNSQDFIAARYSLDGFSNEMLAVCKPRNSSAGSWDPFAEPEKPVIEEKLLILQAGASTNGAITRSFVELYNNTGSAINLNTYSIQYGTTGTSWTVINLTGTIPVRGSYLVVGPLGTTNAENRLFIDESKTDQVVDGFTLNNNGFKVALMSNQTALAVENPFSSTGGGGYVDMLGAYNSGTAIDAYETAVAAVVSKQAAARRKSLADTDDNSYDFARIDYRVVNGSNGISDEDVAKYRPRYSGDGSWTPTF